MTIDEFIQKYHVKCEAIRVAGRHDVDDDGESSWSADARHWSVQLTRTERRGPGFVLSFSQGSAHTKAPNARDVLDCLASDVSGIDQPFESWASDLGYDPDSRKAERTYQQIKRQAKRLEDLLGAEGVAALLACERL